MPRAPHPLRLPAVGAAGPPRHRERQRPDPQRDLAARRRQPPRHHPVRLRPSPAQGRRHDRRPLRDGPRQDARPRSRRSACTATTPATSRRSRPRALARQRPLHGPPRDRRPEGHRAQDQADRRAEKCRRYEHWVAGTPPTCASSSPSSSCCSGSSRASRPPPHHRRSGLPGLPGRQSVEHRHLEGARRHVAQLHRLARDDGAVARLRRQRRVRHPVRERAVLRSRWCRSRSTSTTSPTRARTRSRPTRRSRAAATATCWCCARATASCSSSTRPRSRARAGTPTAARVWNLNSNALRPERWTSADAAGLPILPGLARRDESRGGDQARAADHGPDHAEGLHPPRHALGVLEHRTATSRRWACACG